MTAGYGAPVPSREWTFKWSGFMSASLQFSVNQRQQVAEGQTRTVLHAAPQTIDEWYSFVSTNMIPGNWVAMNFQYGNDRVSANVSLTTWNLTDPSTYYQIGSQQFINNAFLLFTPEEIEGFRIRWTVGYFSNSYGNLGQYGPGMYVNSLMGFVRGAGETLVVEHDVSDDWAVALEHGLMGPRVGKTPDAAVGSPGLDNPLWQAAWIHHAHLGLIQRSDPARATLQFQLHYVGNWSQDDTVRYAVDNPGTHAVDESNVPDGRIDAVGFDTRVISATWGVLGVGAAYIRGRNAYTLKGYSTWAGDGEGLTDRFLGADSGGNGNVYVAGINYGVSLARVLSHPEPFAGDGPDVVVNLGGQIATASTSFGPWDGRVRHKYGADVLYTPFRYLGIGVRADRVVPNSRDSQETFHAISPRLQFKSDWNSRETITVRYAKWFYGPHTHSDGLGARQIDRLDDQLFALNFNMWW
jgi:hypothetical protein